MRNDQSSGFFVIEGIPEGTKNIRSSDGIIIPEDALEVSILMQYVKFRKNGELYLELMN